ALLGADFVSWWGRRFWSDAFPLHPSSSHIPRACETCWWQGRCIHGRGESSSFGKSSSENFGRPGVVMGELSQLWGSPVQPCRVAGHGLEQAWGAVVIPLMQQEGFLRVP
ncbi:hypothetical protein Nmel_014521, partial [Mimus melanotis]